MMRSCRACRKFSKRMHAEKGEGAGDKERVWLGRACSACSLISTPRAEVSPAPPPKPATRAAAGRACVSLHSSVSTLGYAVDR